MSRPRQLVAVVGTGTEVGKTWVACRLLEAWRRRGLSVSARKPAQSFDPAEGVPTDAELLAAATGEDPDSVCDRRHWYPVPLAPPMAARRLGVAAPVLGELLAGLDWPHQPCHVGLLETAGGLRSPQATDGDALDMVVGARPDLVVTVADAGLGTIGAVRLVSQALEVEELPYVVVLNRFDSSEPLHQENLIWLRDVDGLDVVAGAEGIESVADRVVGPIRTH